jgi:predicted dithiol-disulfide oxidoreductase (DUF899 family)
MVHEEASLVVSHEDWLIARKELLAREQELTRQLDTVRAVCRQLPCVEVEKSYVFEGARGKRTLADLFGGRSHLAVYHCMLTPGSDHICDGCAFVCDHVDAATRHFEHADLSFTAVSGAPIARSEAV